MQRQAEMRSPGEQNPGFWGRLTLWVGLNRPVVWLIGLTAGLILFLVWLPPYMRMFFGHSLRSQPILASMTLRFSLVALSLLWSAGERMDTWVFRVFNLRGRRPPWLDGLMWGLTQLGNGPSFG